MTCNGDNQLNGITSRSPLSLDPRLPMMICLEDGDVVAVSTEWHRLTGYSAADLATYADWVRLALHSKISSDLRGTQDVEMLHSQEIETRAGSVLNCDMALVPVGIRSDGGKVIAVTILNNHELSSLGAMSLFSEQVALLINELDLYGIWTTDASGRSFRGSQSLLDLLGVSADELWEHGLVPYIDPEQLPDVMDRWAHCVNTGENWEYEIRLRDKRNRWRVVQSRAKAKLDQNGAVAYWVGISMDVTEHARAIDELRRSEHRYRSLFENNRDSLAYCRIVMDGSAPVDYEYLEVNQAYEALTGLHDVVGRKVSEVMPGFLDMDRELLALYADAALSGKPFKQEIYVSALRKWLSVSVYSPATEYFIVVFDDITAHKSAEIALKRSEELYQSLYNSMNEGFALHEMIYDELG